MYFGMNNMKDVDLKPLLAALREGPVEVTFVKVRDGETRVMPCTLNAEYLENVTKTVATETWDISQNRSFISVWALDQKAWRGFRPDKVTSWKKL